MYQGRQGIPIKAYQDQSGFSLLDLIVGISILAIGFTVFVISSSNITTSESRGEIIIEATNIANNVMESIRKLPFDENSEPPYSTILGREESGNIYDDIDDCAGRTWVDPATINSSFRVTSRVYYVDGAVSWEDSVGSPTTLKRIIVRVNHSELPNGFELSSIIGVK